LATWPHLHAAVTIAALEAGKHVLTQARMAMDSIHLQLLEVARISSIPQVRSPGDD
jgi:predicted dehydrogenase